LGSSNSSRKASFRKVRYGEPNEKHNCHNGETIKKRNLQGTADEEAKSIYTNQETRKGKPSQRSKDNLSTTFLLLPCTDRHMPAHRASASCTTRCGMCWRFFGVFTE